MDKEKTLKKLKKIEKFANSAMGVMIILFIMSPVLAIWLGLLGLKIMASLVFVGLAVGVLCVGARKAVEEIRKELEV